MEWISVKDSLPEKNKNVLLFMKNNTHSWVQIGISDDFYPSWFVCDACLDHVEINFDELVTHWMPLPEPPIGQ